MPSLKRRQFYLGLNVLNDKPMIVINQVGCWHKYPEFTCAEIYTLSPVNKRNIVVFMNYLLYVGKEI